MSKNLQYLDCNISKLFFKPLGSGEETSVALMEDNIHVIKKFNQPRDFNEEYNLLIGSNLDQTTYSFYDKLYHNNSFIIGGRSIYASGEKLNNKIINVPFANLSNMFKKAKEDTKIISDAGIQFNDNKDFNTIYNENYIRIVDTGRFEYSNINKEELYNQNLSKFIDLIKSSYLSNYLIINLIEKEQKLSQSFSNNNEFEKFFKEIEEYTSNKLNKHIKSLSEYLTSQNK